MNRTTTPSDQSLATAAASAAPIPISTPLPSFRELQDRIHVLEIRLNGVKSQLHRRKRILSFLQFLTHLWYRAARCISSLLTCRKKNRVHMVLPSLLSLSSTYASFQSTSSSSLRAIFHEILITSTHTTDMPPLASITTFGVSISVSVNIESTVARLCNLQWDSIIVEKKETSAYNQQQHIWRDTHKCNDISASNGDYTIEIDIQGVL